MHCHWGATKGVEPEVGGMQPAEWQYKLWDIHFDGKTLSVFNSFFLFKLIVACRLCVIYVREDNDSIV